MPRLTSGAILGINMKSKTDKEKFQEMEAEFIKDRRIIETLFKFYEIYKGFHNEDYAKLVEKERDEWVKENTMTKRYVRKTK
jgi:hypothetical protein